MIGIRLADGKIFSICTDAPGRKRLVLSPAADGQKKAKIDLLHFSDSSFSDACHLGALFLDGVGGEIELSVEVRGGKVLARAFSPATGAEDSIDVSFEKPSDSDADCKGGLRSEVLWPWKDACVLVMSGALLAILIFLAGFLFCTMIPGDFCR